MTTEEANVAEIEPVRPTIAAATATEPEGPPPSGSPLLERLLAVADGHRAEGSLHQAMELYFLLVEDHQHTPQAGQACKRLMDIAESHEKEGERHAARSIYERLLRNE